MAIHLLLTRWEMPHLWMQAIWYVFQTSPIARIPVSLWWSAPPCGPLSSYPAMLPSSVELTGCCGSKTLEHLLLICRLKGRFGSWSPGKVGWKPSPTRAPGGTTPSVSTAFKSRTWDATSVDQLMHVTKWWFKKRVRNVIIIHTFLSDNNYEKLRHMIMIITIILITYDIIIIIVVV